MNPIPVEVVKQPEAYSSIIITAIIGVLGFFLKNQYRNYNDTRNLSSDLYAEVEGIERSHLPKYYKCL